MDPKELTLEDIQKYENEIQTFYSKRKMFLGIGWGCIGLAILLSIISITLGVNGSKYGYIVFVYFASFAFAGGIICFILRSALFSKRIQTRKILIEQARQYQNSNEFFEKNENR